MDILEVFSKKLGKTVPVVQTPEGIMIDPDSLCPDDNIMRSDLVSDDPTPSGGSWINGGWKAGSKGWTNNGWAAGSKGWINNGWNASSGSWINGGWKAGSKGWSNGGWVAGSGSNK